MVDLVLSGPGKNALSTARMLEVQEGLARAGGAPVLLTGDGDAFSAGLHLVEVAGLDAAGTLRFLTVLEDMISALFHYPGPVVGFINGHAIAGGCILALCCDHRVCAPTPGLKFGLNEVPLGLRFPRGILQVVRRRVAPQHLEEVVLGGRLYAPAEAQRLGLCDELGDLAAARARLDELARHPADAYALAKRELRAGVLDDDPATRRAYLEEALPIWTAPALRERLNAFLQRPRRA
jgi:enoyl-CoA hydratase/carnithine racemase